MESISVVESQMRDHYTHLREAFTQALEAAVQDPLMKCFSENSESRKYMFDRMQEVIEESMKTAHSESVHELIQTCDGLEQEVKNLMSLQGHGSKSALNSQIFELQKEVYNKEDEFKRAEKEAARLEGEIEDRNSRIRSLEASLAKADHGSERLAQEVKTLGLKNDRILEEKQLIGAKVHELNEQIRQLRNLEEPLQRSVDEKIRENEKLTKRNLELEQSVKRLEYTLTQNEDLYNREYKKIVEENEIIEKKLREIQKLNTTSTKKNDEGAQKVLSLEEVNKSLKDKLETMTRKVEDLEFSKGTVEEHLKTLKDEIKETCEKNTELKREKHMLEVEAMELGNKYSETQVERNRIKEDNEKMGNERDYLRIEYEKLEKQVKIEKRKTSNLERELDQMKYSHDTLHRSTMEEIKALRDHNQMLKQEGKSLQDKIENQFKEMQVRLEEERKNGLRGLKKIKEMENEEENLRLQVESLLKKVEFFKAQQKQDSVQARVDSRDSYAEKQKFDSFSSFQKRVKEIGIAPQEDKKHFRSWKNENDALRIKLSTIALQMGHIKEIYRKECQYFKQEISNLKTSLFQSLQMLTCLSKPRQTLEDTMYSPQAKHRRPYYAESPDVTLRELHSEERNQRYEQERQAQRPDSGNNRREMVYERKLKPQFAVQKSPSYAQYRCKADNDQPNTPVYARIHHQSSENLLHNSAAFVRLNNRNYPTETRERKTPPPQDPSTKLGDYHRLQEANKENSYSFQNLPREESTGGRYKIGKLDASEFNVNRIEEESSEIMKRLEMMKVRNHQYGAPNAK